MEFIQTLIDGYQTWEQVRDAFLLAHFGEPEFVGSWVFQAIAAVGSLVSAYGTYKAGREEQKSASRAAADMRWNAGKIRERGRMEAGEIRRQTNRTMSDAAAMQAASGFAASDPSDLRQLAEISGAGKWNEIAALYESEMAAQGELRASRNLRKSGQAAKRAGTYGAVGSLIKSAGTFSDAWGSFSSRNTGGSDFMGPPKRGGGY